MSKGINKWIGIGNLCTDPEVKYMPSGGAVCNVTIACNDSYKDKSTGNIVDKTEFVRVIFFNRLAEVAGEYLRKGSQVYVEGRIKTRKWQDQSGQDRYSTEIIAEEMRMLGSGNGGTANFADNAEQGSKSEPATQPSSAPQEPQLNNTPPPAAYDDFNDDIPF